MMVERRCLLSTEDVARTLGFVTADGAPALDRFYRARAALRERQFPEPVIGRKRGQRWDPVAITRWLDLQLPDRQPAQDDLAGWEAELAQRLEG